MTSTLPVRIPDEWAARSTSISPDDACTRHLGLGARWAAWGMRRGLDHDDAWQCVRLGLWRASLEWRPGTATWATAALSWIRGAMTREVKARASLVRLPSWRHERGERPPWCDSLDAPAPHDGPTLYDMMPSRGPTPEQEAARHEAGVILSEIIGGIHPGGRAALRAVALDLSDAEIATAEGVSRQATRLRRVRASERIERTLRHMRVRGVNDILMGEP